MDREDGEDKLDRCAQKGSRRHTPYSLPILFCLRSEAARVAKVTAVTGDASPGVARRWVHPVRCADQVEGLRAISGKR